MAAAIVDHRPDAIITGHEVMGPFIAKLACERTQTEYVAKLHGSALEYAVKLQPRYLRFATEGLCAARVVVGGSRYMVDEASATVPGWRDRAVVVNPGCDVELFRPVEKKPSSVAVVGYVGKLIAAKGVHDLLVALGETAAPVRAVIVGYGELEGVLKDVAGRLKEGDVNAARVLLEEVDDPAVHRAVSFLISDAVNDSYRERLGQVEVTFTGRLEHDPLSRLLPTFDLLVVPSVVSEAFGLVAAEAAASGVLPLVPNHSGIGEAGAAIEAAISRPGWLTYDSRDPVTGIAGAIDRVLAVPIEERSHLGRIASQLARSRWSWRHVSQTLLDLAVG
jgi:glycosyltransferase involved in cell wall biosynthesis